ncbi:MAG TPA: aminoglycoside phosphotransferase family protein [Pyrinomonadaceae bacterium]
MILRPVSAELIRECISFAFPNLKIATAQLLSGGLLNTNIKIDFRTDAQPVVLRLHRGDAAVCLKESAVLRLVRSTVPVPEVIFVEPNGIDGCGPFSILEFVKGQSFQWLKRTNDLEAIHQAAASVGQTLASIGKHQFQKSGRLQVEGENELTVGEAYIKGPDPIPRLLDQFLESACLQRRLDGPLQQKLHDFIWSWAAQLRTLDHQCHLVHGDFGNRNILVDRVSGRWQVVAVLDWEFALSESPLLDVGHFLRYEKRDTPLREPYFSRAFVEYGGSLPDNWRRISQVVDLTALVECMTHEQLPDEVAVEILELIKSTVASCEV